jgi:hypothetical protein
LKPVAVAVKVAFYLAFGTASLFSGRLTLAEHHVLELL